MEAPVLTLAEQKVALSKRKKKKVLKNVLGLPKYLKVESQSIADSEVEKLKKILERLLPSARLPDLKNFQSKDITPQETALKESALVKRKQLSLGVNELNKSIKKGLVSAALLASDVEPKFLVHHLNLLCTHNKIPYLHMVKLREITKKCLGFPCIALGFRNNSDFSEAINKIKDISAGLEKNEDSEKSDIDVTDSERITEDEEAKNEPPVIYLYRSSTKERVFVPENDGNDGNDEKTDGFIPFDKGDDVKFEKKVSGVSFHLARKKGKKKLKPEDDSSSEEEFQVPKKKSRKESIGTQKPKYYPVNLAKVSSNPDRVGKKRKS